MTLVQRLLALIPEETKDKILQNNAQGITSFSSLVSLWSTEAEESLELEACEDELALIGKIKAFSVQKKAEYAVPQMDEFFEELEGDGMGGDNKKPKRPSSSTNQFRRSYTSGLSKEEAMLSREVCESAKFRMSLNSFFKTNNRSTAISSNESFRSMHNANNNNQENEVSELVANNEVAMVGTPSKMLRGRGQQNKKPSSSIMQSVSTISGGVFPKDIHGLINDFHQDAKSFKKQINIDEIRSKITQNSQKNLITNNPSHYSSNSDVKKGVESASS